MKSENVIENLNFQMPRLRQQQTALAQQGLNHLPLTDPRAYYRSKVFSVTTGINPLVNAAASLLTTIAYLRETTYLGDVRQLHQELIHEIKVFETQAQTQNYRSELILVGRYILCATLDETILTSLWGAQSDWPKYKLLPTFHSEDWGGERFFLILERLSADPAIHIDILELIYLCLNLGFTGKFQLIPNSDTDRHKISENLYQLIRWQRGDLKKELLLEEINPENKPTPANGSLPTWLIGLFLLMIILTLYVAFNFMLGTSTNSLYQQFLNLSNYSS